MTVPPVAPAVPVAPALSAGDRRAVLAAAREVTRAGRDLEGRWTRRLRAAGTVIPPGGGLPESAFLAPGGGYRIQPGLCPQLGDAAAAFPYLKAAPDGWAYLRDYGYYAADPAMYLPGRVPLAWQRWQVIARRWPRYAGLGGQAASWAASPPVPWCRWLAWLSFLEAAVNDLCSLAWSALCLGDEDAAGQAGTGIEALCGLLAEAAWHWWAEPSRARPGAWPGRLAAVTANPGLAGVIAGMSARLQAAGAAPWAVRAIREGDIFWQAAAAYEAWWAPVRAAHPGGRFLLVSEAFGAMAAGPAWAAMMPGPDRAVTALAVGRHSVHEQEMNRVPGSAWRTRAVPADGRVVIHLDDSVFSGQTHTALRGALTGVPEAVYLVPFSLDVGTPVNHPQEVTVLGRTVAGHMEYVTRLARAPGGQLPPAFSMWARRKRQASDPAARVLGGSDRLLAVLWHRYAREIGHA